MGHFVGTLDSVNGSAGPSRGAQSRAAPKNKETIYAPPPSIPTSDSTPRAGENPVRASPEPSSPSPTSCQDKGKQLVNEPSN